MKVPIHSLMAEVGPAIKLVVFAEERSSYVFKLYSDTLFGRFESPAAVMFSDELLFCDDGKTVSAVNAESVLRMLYRRFRKVDDASL